MAKTLKFNPAFQSDDEAIANFIVRNGELEAVLAGLEVEPSARPPRMLIVAPRGAGKTTLCRRVLAETRRSATLSASWHAIFLGEESYTVTTPGEFFLECLFQLRDQAPEASLDEAYAAAAAATDEAALVHSSLRALSAYSREISKRLLVIVENFHIILHDQIGSGAKELLRHISASDFLGILATSVSQGSQEDEINLPDDYEKILLKPLDIDECLELWRSLTDQSVKTERIRPLQILTGGSPRLLHILADFMRTPSLRDLMENLNLLIDQNTEYFKSQLDALPAIERKVFAALLDAWDPSTAKQISESARVNTNVASAMLSRLSDRGSVIKEPGRGKASIYYASERLFNIYYLMRRRSHPSSRVRALVSFMTEYYDRDELIDTTAILVQEACAVEPEQRGDYHSTFDAIMSRASEAVRRRILEQTPQEFIRSFRADSRERRSARSYLSIEGAAGAGPTDEDEISPLVERIEVAADAGDFDLALELVREMIERRPEVADPWIRLSLIQQARRDLTEAVTAAARANELMPDNPWTHAVLGTALARAARKDEAIASFQKALRIDAGQIMAISELAQIREDDGDNDEALGLYRQARAAGRLSDLVRSRYALLLLEEGATDEAEEVLREGLAEGPANIESRRVLVDHLDDTDRQAEAISILRSAAENLDSWEGWADLGAFLHARTEQWDEAAAALACAIEQGGDEPWLYRQQAHALVHAEASKEVISALADAVIERFPASSEAWTAAGSIHRLVYEDARAEEAYQRSIALGGGDAAKMQLARLLCGNSARRAEAEALLREVLAAAEGRRRCGPSKELAELLIHDGNDLAADEVVRSALESNDACYCCAVLHGQICTRQGNTEAATERYRAALELNPEGIPALTGLARLVDDPQEAQRLIERAIQADPTDPRCYLARAWLRGDDVDAQIEDGREALNLAPDFAEANLFLAPLEAARGNIDEALGHLDDALAELPDQKELLPSFVAAAMRVARRGGSEGLSRLLSSHENGGLVEPLAVALQLERGEQPMVAKEVLEVAKDIAGTET